MLHWRLDGTVALQAFDVSFPAQSAGEAKKGERSVYFPELDGYARGVVHDRYRLVPGAHGPGPALVEERESTIVVGPNADWEVDQLSNLVITLR
jgi:N-methylhydantoinase A